MKRLTVFTLLLMVWVSAAMAAKEPRAKPVTIFVTEKYAFDYQSNPEAPKIAQALCGTRCNALSGNYDSYKVPGGWRLIQIGMNVEKIVDLDSPFVHGKCICTGELYQVSDEHTLIENPRKYLLPDSKNK